MSKNQTKEEISQRMAAVVIPADPLILLDEFQMAKLQNHSVHKLRRDRWAGGGIPFIRVGGMIRYSRVAADKYNAANTRISTSDPGNLQKAA